jgi:sodium-coupled monocarboxylate transporter 8/12
MDFTVDPFMRHNVLNIVLGQGFTIFCLYGTHQPQVQRYCSLPTLKDAIKATAFGIPLSVFTIGTCLLAGIVIFSTYDGCDPIATGKIPVVDIIVPHFVKDKLGFIPGMMGLFTACVFSASLSTLSSGLNSLAAVTWEDFLAKIPGFPELRSDVRAGIIRFLAVWYGILSIALAFVAQHMGSILPATITALGALSGPLGAIFVMGLLMPFINRKGAIVGMLSGFIIMCWITVGAFRLGKSHIPLPVSEPDDECLERLTNSYIPKNITLHAPIDWPEKIYTISYITYSFVGGMITFIISGIVSLLTGGWQGAKHIDNKYLHPLIRRKATLLHKAETKDANFNYTEKRVDRLDPTFVRYDPLATNDRSSGTGTPETPGFPGSPTERPLLYRLPSYNR